MAVNPLKIDLNADLGEGGTQDEALMPLISSANIACGGHAGDTQSMRRTLLLAKQYGVNVGAHPSYPDREHFGRISMTLSPEALYATLHQQISILKALCDDLSIKLIHIKPHGALYNDAANNKALGQIIIKVIKAIDPRLKLMILAGSPLVEQAKAAGIEVIEEAFADRSYLADGTLAPRSQPGAVLHDADKMLAQVSAIIERRQLTAITGETIPCTATSLCLHGDNQEALRFAKLIRSYVQP